MTNAVVIDGKVYERRLNYTQKFNPLDMCYVEDTYEILEDSFDFVGWELPDVPTREEAEWLKDLREVGCRPFYP